MMENFGVVLEGIASLLLPVITIIFIIVLIVLFKPAIAAIIESAKSRKFTLKIGGQEITMEEANKQQRDIISDIQSQLIELRDRIKHDTKPVSDLAKVSPSMGKMRKVAILWVDDNPRNNSSYIQQLQDMELSVDLSLSTSDGIKRFEQKDYALVISDMGRQEKDLFNDIAGLNLLKEIRAINPDIPFIVFTTFRAARQHESKAKELGATLITSSWTEIMGILLKVFVEG